MLDKLIVDELSLTLRFYELILPEKGVRIVEKKHRSGGLQREFVATNEELCELVRRLDQDGFEVYHARAVYKEAINDSKGTPEKERRFGRTKQNVLGASSLWIDGDLHDPVKHPNIPYRRQGELLEALGCFCRETGLPIPLIIESGSGGCHFYWPLSVTLTPAEWKRYAVGLKNLCIQHSFVVDHARTTHIASILRPPFTHNRKNPGKERRTDIIIISKHWPAWRSTRWSASPGCSMQLRSALTTACRFRNLPTARHLNLHFSRVSARERCRSQASQVQSCMSQACTRDQQEKRHLVYRGGAKLQVPILKLTAHSQIKCPPLK